MLPTSRKYLGSKHALSGWIGECIVAEAGVPARFLDGFAGTGAVAVELARRGAKSIVCVDNLLSNVVVLDAYFTALDEPTSRSLRRFLHEVSLLPGCAGYATAAFGERYFTRANAMRIDAVREAIAAVAAANPKTSQVHAICGRFDSLGRGEAAVGTSPRLAQAALAALLLGADRAANTLGQYDAYLKHLGRPSMADGRHLVDTRVYEPLRLTPLEPLAGVGQPYPSVDVLCADLLAVLPQIDVDVAYFDPPYNARQYCDNYHVLENLARWQRPPVYGKTRKFDRTHLKSPFSRQREVRAAFAELMQRCRAPLVFVSYNSEGLVAAAELERLLADFGTVTRYDHRYPVFGGGAGVARKREVVEYLFVVHVG